MGKRKVTILEPAVEEVARIALYIEGNGLPITARSGFTLFKISGEGRPPPFRESS
jgi:hypothetical protein